MIQCVCVCLCCMQTEWVNDMVASCCTYVYTNMRVKFSESELFTSNSVPSWWWWHWMGSALFFAVCTGLCGMRCLFRIMMPQQGSDGWPSWTTYWLTSWLTGWSGGIMCETTLMLLPANFAIGHSPCSALQTTKLLENRNIIKGRI